MSEFQPKSSSDLLTFCLSCNWIILDESEEHTLLRNRSGAWVTIPKGESDLSGLYGNHFFQLLRAEFEQIMQEAEKLTKRANKLSTFSAAFIFLGVALFAAPFFSVRSKLHPMERPTLTPFWVAALAIGVLCPIGYWLGKSVIGPRLAKSKPLEDRPFVPRIFDPPKDEPETPDL